VTTNDNSAEAPVTLTEELFGSMGIWFAPSMMILLWLSFRVDRLPVVELVRRIRSSAQIQALSDQTQ
jgi:hypothetical protein